MTRDKILLALILALIALHLVGLVISVSAGWPAEVEGADPKNVLGDSLSRGTLLSAPVIWIVLLAVYAPLALKGGRWLASIALVGIIIVGAIYALSTVAEPREPELSDPPLGFLFAWRAVGVLLATAMAVVSSFELRDRLIPERVRPRR
jgi:hypothetical protein